MESLPASLSSAAPAWPAGLPHPSPEEAASSAPLVRRIREALAARGGAIPFARYMELALYAPGLGYYSGRLPKLGAKGDFVTAPELSPLFSRCLARQCAQILAEIPDASVLEAGAGSGRMAADLLVELARLEMLPARYQILELSGALRERQAATLQEVVPELCDRVGWLERLPAPGFRGVLLANEVLDAMPVHRLQLAAEGPREYYVCWEDGRFAWRIGALSEPALAEAVAEVLGDLPAPPPPGYVMELGLSQPAWVASVGERLAAGVLLVIDYGFPRRELYHPQRAEGTLMCHYRHRAHPNPLILTGLQDMTAHVDFTALGQAGTAVGLRLAGYTSQASFLLANGLTEALEAGGVGGTPDYLTRANAVKRLTLPGEMGELFKVMALTRNLSGPLRGFALQDRSGRL